MIPISEEQARIDYKAAIAEANRHNNAELLTDTTRQFPTSSLIH
jgi:hypothetical protein